MSDLKPCPFCGGEAEAHEVTFPYHYWDVLCDGECFDHFCEKPTKAEAIAAWNTRAETATLYEYGFYLNGKKFVPERTCRMTDRGECSECGAYIVRAWTEVHDFNGDMKRIDLRSHNYCPNCGARVGEP